MYDITVITDNQTGINNAVKHLKDHGSNVKRQIDLGTKSFVYPIETKREGIYTIFIVELKSDQLTALNRELSLDPTILRHLVLTTKNLDPLKTQERSPEYASRENQKEDQAVRGFKPTASAEVKKPAIAKPAAKPVVEEKVSTKDREKALNKQLEEILEG